MKLKVALFDIDGTLMHSGGAGRSAIDEAVELVSGITSALDGIRLHGNTDKLIMGELQKTHDEFFKKGDLVKVEQLYLDLLPSHLSKSTKVERLGGAKALLNYLKLSGVSIGVTTGNLERGAYAKLDAVNLKSFFNFGGFGDDAAQRCDILKKGVERSGHKRENVIFFGDTPFDGEAGQIAGVVTVGVTTGIYSATELLNSGCACVVSSLSQVSPAILHALSQNTQK